MPAKPPQHSSIRTGDVVVLLRNSEGVGYRDRITIFAADEIREKV